MNVFFLKVCIFLLLGASTASAQELPQEICPQPPFIRGLRVYGGSDETNLPVIIKADSSSSGKSFPLPTFITIRFDVAEESPPRLAIRFHHCDKNWNIDSDYFVRDDFFTYTRLLSYEQSTAGIDGYRWRFTNSFPAPDHPFVRFLYSGNWIFDVTDEQDADIIYASGRFIVVEQGIRAQLGVRNDYWTPWDTPFDQVHRLRLEVRIPNPGPLFPDYVKTVDFYRNFDLFRNYRVDSYDRQDNTFVEGLGMDRKVFTYENVPPGNGYRLFDLRRPAMYPSRQIARKFEGADFTRFRFGTDRSTFYGAAITEPLRSFDADYLCVEFELECPPVKNGDLFVAGIFNNWDPQPEDRMTFDKKSNHYVLHRWLLRGAYDYQYVVGSYDEELGYVANADWLRLEGNGWGANNLYWAIIYYDDDQFGGVNRAVGFTSFMTGQ